MSADHPFWLANCPLVLASGSAARAHLLDTVQIPFVIDKPSVDERAIEAPLLAGGAGAAEIASALADAKAMNVSQRRMDDYVIGSDQMLAISGSHLTKAETRAAAADHLRRMSGTSHTLHSSASIARGGEILSRTSASATLTMRPLSDDFIDRYLDFAGASVLGSVGVYQIEGLGLHLFQRVEGDHATIMGLPLLALLADLRRLGLLRG